MYVERVEQYANNDLLPPSTFVDHCWQPEGWRRVCLISQEFEVKSSSGS